MRIASLAVACALSAACVGMVGDGSSGGGGTAGSNGGGAAGGDGSTGGGTSAGGGMANGGGSPGGGEGGGTGANGGGGATGSLDGGRDAGAGGGPVDAGGDAGVDGGNACAGAFLCDDFERYDAGRAPGQPWGTALNSGSIQIDSTRAASGRQAVKASIQAGTAQDSFRRAMISLRGAPYFPLAQNAVYGRMKLFIPMLPPNSDVHYDFVWGSGNATAAGGETQVKYGAMDRKHFLANYWESPTSTDCWKSSSTSRTMPEGRWVCFEWHFDGARDTAHLWIDGTPVPEVTVVGTGDGCVNKPSVPWHFPTFNHLELGWIAYQPYGAVEMWLDDVALGNQRLFCPP